MAALRHSARDATRGFSPNRYHLIPDPGDALENPSTAGFANGQMFDEGVENILAVTLAIRSPEWLYPAHQGHRRARFVWDESGQIKQTWLVP